MRQTARRVACRHCIGSRLAAVASPLAAPVRMRTGRAQPSQCHTRDTCRASQCGRPCAGAPALRRVTGRRLRLAAALVPRRSVRPSVPRSLAAHPRLAPSALPPRPAPRAHPIPSRPTRLSALLIPLSRVRAHTRRRRGLMAMPVVEVLVTSLSVLSAQRRPNALHCTALHCAALHSAINSAPAQRRAVRRSAVRRSAPSSSARSA